MHEVLAALRRNSALYDGATVMSDDRGSVTRAGLAARVSALAESLRPLPERIGLLGENGVEWSIAQLAGWLTGKVVVPLPMFFSLPQLGHIVMDAGLTHAMTTRGGEETAAKLGLVAIRQSSARREAFPASVGGGGQIIYTSGSTGRPKGVRLALDQIDASARMLREATKATRSDVYLSLLPLPLLLETISAIAVPLIAGARTHFDRSAASSLARGDGTPISAAFERHCPTTSVIVPELLSAWVADLERRRVCAPASLRFLAVGGAHVPKALAERAWAAGIPVHEGYGLSECTSVVAVNRPGRRRPGSVGQPLQGLAVRIDAGEIVVDGATVMQGYLHGSEVTGPWRTGDLGAIDRDGYLTVYGRKDNLIVTSMGRNVSPEWIEAMLLADQRIAAVAVVCNGEPHLCAVIVPSPAGDAWLARATKAQVLLAIAIACSAAPDYAVPKDYLVISREDAAKRGLITAKGHLNRAALAAIRQGKPQTQSDRKRAHGRKTETVA